MRTQIRQITFALVTCALMSGCGGGRDSETSSPPDLAPAAQAQADITAFDNIDASALKRFDGDNHHLLSQVFGDPSGAAIRAFVSDRIHHFVTLEEFKAAKITRFQSTRWTNVSSPSEPSRASDPSGASNSESVSPKTVAANLGTQFWLMGLVDNVQPTFTWPNGQELIIDSPRVGLMLFGPNYRTQITTSNGDVIKLPRLYRQAVLVHEGRHSDCTGGITKQDLAAFRVAPDYGSAYNSTKAVSCGHMHSLCRSGAHAGLPACDAHPWGSYTMDTVFVAATLLTTSGIDRAILEATLIDLVSRLEFDVKAMFEGRLGPPDMSNAGVK